METQLVTLNQLESSYNITWFLIDGNHFDKAMKLRNKCRGLYEQKIEIQKKGWLLSKYFYRIRATMVGSNKLSQARTFARTLIDS